jgi:hypothetical protein
LWIAVLLGCGGAHTPDADRAAAAADTPPSRGAAVVAPPPAGSRADAPWSRLAGWAAESYAALGFPDAPPSVQVDVLEEADPARLMGHAAREFALEVMDVGTRTQTDTHWILRRALDIRSEDTPEAQLSHEVERMIRATPLWYDRRLCAVRVVGAHPLFAKAGFAQAGGGAAWEPWHLMAHEVAHALQDRRAPFREAQVDTETYEAHVVKKCLYEGEADLRMLALAAAMDGRDLVAAGADWCNAEIARLFERATPSYYEAGFRYLLGELFAGGWPAVESAVLVPRVSSRDLLTGARTASEPAALELPAWPAVIAGSIEHEWRDEVGAWGILALLAEAGVDVETSDELGELVELVSTWRADGLAVACRTDGVAVLMWRIVASDAEAAHALAHRLAVSAGTASFAETTVDFAWSPVKPLELLALEQLEASR